MRRIFAFLADECATIAIEYALIAGGISIAILAVVNSMGTSLNAQYQSVSTSFR